MNKSRWRQSLASSLQKSSSKERAKYFQIANVDEQGFPRNRTMVFRGFAENKIDLLAITDSRSKKYGQWQNNSKAEICWYFDLSREQYRISASLRLIDSTTSSRANEKNMEQQQRQALWSSLSPNAKSQFYWPQPGENYDPDNLQGFKIAQSTIDKEFAPSTFVVLVFEPKSVEYLDLKTFPQIREISELRKNADANSIEHWDVRQINP